MLILPTVLAEAKEKSSVFLIELYIFRLRNTTLYYAACDEEIPWFIPGTSNPVVYKPFPIEREDINTSVDGTIDSTKIKVSNINDVFTLALFSGYDFTHKIVDILTISYPDSLTVPAGYTHDFRGYMDAPKLSRKDGTFEVELKSPMPDCQPGRTFMLSCNAEFGDPDDCGASLDTQVGIIQTGSSSNEIIIEQTRDDDYWKDGIITIANESRNIEGNVGKKISLRYPLYVEPVGNYNISRGCDKTKPSCIERQNLQNHSGFPAIPFELVVKS